MPIEVFRDAVKRFRTQADKSPYQLGYLMGMESTAPIYGWEAGRRSMSRQYVERFANALGLSPVARHYLRGLAGHADPIYVPEADQVFKELDELVLRAETFPYPVYTFDRYGAIYWVANSATREILGGISDQDLVQMGRNRTTLFETLFHPGIEHTVEDIDLFRDDVVSSYQLWLRWQRHLRVFQDIPQVMQSKLPAPAYATFESLWDAKSNVVERGETSPRQSTDFSLYGSWLASVSIRDDSDKPCRFVLFDVRPLGGSELFNTVVWLPDQLMNDAKERDANFDRCQRKFANYNHKSRCFTIRDKDVLGEKAAREIIDSYRLAVKDVVGRDGDRPPGGRSKRVQSPSK